MIKTRKKIYAVYAAKKERFLLATFSEKIYNIV